MLHLIDVVFDGPLLGLLLETVKSLGGPGADATRKRWRDAGSSAFVSSKAE